MRTRLLVIIMVLVGLLALGLGVPLGLALAQQRQSQMFTDQVTTTVFYAAQAARPLAVGDDDYTQLATDLDRYYGLYGVELQVRDRDGRVVASSRSPAPDLGPAAQERITLALANRRSEVYPLRFPWDDAAFVIAEPVLVDTEVRGAVVSVAPPDELRAFELQVWSLVAAAVVLALSLAVLVALPIVRWILRPVQRLDEGTGRVAAAVLAGATPEPVADGTGPPELRRLSVSFDRMAEIVTQAYSAQRTFVADASHQLRNPLTALSLRLSNLEGHMDAAATGDHAAALEEAERLATLLDGLLALARAERTVPLAEIDVDDGVGDRVELWRPLAEDSGLRLVRAGRSGLRAVAPPGAIETVLDAVLDNAVKYGPPGTAVTVSTVATDAHVEIAVRDRGPGIRPEELDRATGRFWRSPGQSNVEGSGLGLAIAARTTEVAGGELRLELPPDGGLCVVACLPRAPAPAVPPEPAGQRASR